MGIAYYDCMARFNASHADSRKKRDPGRYVPTLTAIVASLLLSACSSDFIPAGKQTYRRAANPYAARDALLYRSNDPQFLQCTARLEASNVRFSPLPDRSFGGGCSTYGAVKLLDLGVPVTNLGPMTCPLANTFAAWARHGVQPAARLILGSEIVRIETMGTYNCRNIAGSARLSEHAHSNAVDVAAFLLADGRRISVAQNWSDPGPSGRFLHIVRASACKRFTTVLSPDYNAAHRDHLHFDLGSGGVCR